MNFHLQGQHSAEDDARQVLRAGPSLSLHSTDDYSNNTEQFSSVITHPIINSPHYEYKNLSWLEAVYRTHADRKGNEEPLNLFDCDRTIPRTIRHYPFAHEQPLAHSHVAPLASSAAGNDTNDIAAACEGTASYFCNISDNGLWIGNCFSPNSYEDSPDVSLNELFLQSNGNFSLLMSPIRSLLNGTIQTCDFRFIDDTSSASDSAPMSLTHVSSNGQLSSGAFTTNSNLINSLLTSEGQSRRQYFREQPLPYYHELPPPTYTEATEGLTLQK